MKIKKLLSILLVAILMIGCVGITASAEDETVTVSLLGEKQAIVGGEYEVILNVEETTADLAGGISCDVMYDSTKFEFKRVEINSEFAAANNLSDADTKIIDTSTSGKIGILLLDVPNDAAKRNWLTLVFAVKATAGEITAFELENVNVSNSTGTELLIKDLDDVEVVNNSVYAHMIDVNGASIKKDGKGEIRFEAQLDNTILEAIKSENSNIAEIGFMMLPTIYMDNGDLTNTSKYTSLKYGEKSVASDSFKVSDLPEDFDGKFYCYLEQSTINFKLTTSFSARAFVKLNDGTTYVYSDNQTYDADTNTYKKDIKGGTSSKSCIETAKAIIEEYNVTELEEYLKADTETWTNDYTEIVKKLAEEIV